jgi:SAM-dependent methyltransferase
MLLMHRLDVVEFRDFYASPLGFVVARQLAPVVAAALRCDATTRLLGIGFPTPYLADAGAGAERVLAFMPAGQGVMDWTPSERGSATSLVEEDALPLPDSSIDAAVLVHALEMSDRPHALLAELRRVLTNGGQLVVVVPNRQGPWARSEVSPFGYGRPYSRSQVRGLFSEVGFEARVWTTGLHMPPALWRPLFSAARAIDRIGRIAWPAFAGVHVVSAVKRNVQGVPARARTKLVPSLRPVLAPPAGAVGRYPRDRRKIASSATTFQSVSRIGPESSRPRP